MFKKFLVLIVFAIVSSVFCIKTSAQNRKSVSASEVNGTFRYDFTGKFKGSSNEIKILALGKGKLKISFELVYPFLMNDGEIMVNLGYATGIAEIEADQAVYTAENEYGDEPCRILIGFVKPGEIIVTQESSGSDCGFGHNVSSEGRYKKISSKKPTFDDSF